MQVESRHQKDWEYKTKFSKGPPKASAKKKSGTAGVAKTKGKKDTATMAAKVAAEKKRLAASVKDGMAVAVETAASVA